MRDTRAPRSSSAGTVKLVGASKDNIVATVDLLLKDKAIFKDV